MITVSFFFSGFDTTYDEVNQLFASLKDEFPHYLVLVNIKSDPALEERYRTEVPFIKIGPYRLKPPFNIIDIRVALGAAADREKSLDAIDDPKHAKRMKRGKTISGSDRIAYWLSCHYMVVVNTFLMLYVGLPFLAPVFLKYNLPSLADAIYLMYRPVCHQLAFRSWFLFGEQAYYPRELAHIPGIITYEQIAGSNKVNSIDGRAFIGNDIYGYKVALCERDTAIYGSMLAVGLIFPLLKKKIRPLPWYWWVILGVIPMGIDGVSQLPSVVSNVPSWMIIRESTPFLRVLTGSLFGITTAWYLLPILKEAMDETRQILAQKFTIIPQLSTHQEN